MNWRVLVAAAVLLASPALADSEVCRWITHRTAAPAPDVAVITIHAGSIYWDGMKVTPPTFKTYLIQSGKRVPRYVFLVAWDNADKKHGEALARHIRAKGLLVATHCKGVADLPVRAHGG